MAARPRRRPLLRRRRRTRARTRIRWRRSGVVVVCAVRGRDDDVAESSSSAASRAAVRDPIAARTDTLYRATAIATRRRRRDRPSRWESEESAAARRRQIEEEDAAESEAKRRSRRKARTLGELFLAPREIAFGGATFHGAKAHSAWRWRWLVVNVQAGGEAEFASHVQNRDVWANEAVARLVRDSLVLWQVDADADDGDDDGEGKKVCCYYGLADRADLPAVLFVDPITGQLMEKLHRVTDAGEFLAAADKFTKSKPARPVFRDNRSATALLPSPSPANIAEQEEAAGGKCAR
uniref:UAS domain-containing protein n=1 Tax=Leersia perrieri TaxID=77586 RepID=A0A0D9WXS4_9ORYZ